MSCCDDGIIHGVVGATKALLGIDRTSPDELGARMKKCKGGFNAEPCPESGGGWRCNACGCIISLKISVASEHCPIGKW